MCEGIGKKRKKLSLLCEDAFIMYGCAFYYWHVEMESSSNVVRITYVYVGVITYQTMAHACVYTRGAKCLMLANIVTMQRR